jgi:hypothetical protein
MPPAPCRTFSPRLLACVLPLGVTALAACGGNGAMGPHDDTVGYDALTALDAVIDSPQPPADTTTPSDTAAPTDSAQPPVDAPVATDAGTLARFPPSTRWHIDLEAPVDLTVAADAYDIDLFDNTAADIAQLRARGVRVVCYFSAGSAENWRPDYAMFPAAALGMGLAGWPGERWLDVRDATVRSVMQARMDLARAKGCSGVDPDNVDGYSNSTGFPLGAADQLDYNRFLAREAHARGLAVGLKNDVAQVAALSPDFDFAVNEQCHQYSECDSEMPFVTLGRSVLDIEYAPSASDRTTWCADAARRMFDLILPPMDRLDGTYARCP